MTEQVKIDDRARLVLMVNRDVIRLAKSKAAMREQSLSQVVEDLLRSWVANGQQQAVKK